jgi:hypothetical protein
MQGHRTYLDLSRRPDMRTGFVLVPTNGHREFLEPRRHLPKSARKAYNSRLGRGKASAT